MARMIIYLSLLFVIGCSTPSTVSTSNSRPPIRLEQVENMRLGATKREEVLTIFGFPDMKIPNNEVAQETWLYFEAPYRSSPRVSFTFNLSSALKSATWDVRQGDPESDLERVKNRYNQAKLKLIQSPWINTHAAPDEDLYVDRNLGLTVVFESTPKRVSAIVWEDPKDRSVAETPEN